MRRAINKATLKGVAFTMNIRRIKKIKFVFNNTGSQFILTALRFVFMTNLYII